MCIRLFFHQSDSRKIFSGSYWLWDGTGSTVNLNIEFEASPDSSLWAFLWGTIWPGTVIGGSGLNGDFLICWRFCGRLGLLVSYEVGTVILSTRASNLHSSVYRPSGNSFLFPSVGHFFLALKSLQISQSLYTWILSRYFTRSRPASTFETAGRFFWLPYWDCAFHIIIFLEVLLYLIAFSVRKSRDSDFQHVFVI